MIKGKHGVASVCLLVGCLSAQPVMALSPQALRQQSNHNITTDETLETAEPLTQSTSLSGFLPGLIGPHVYSYLLQSDQFITLQGGVESLCEAHLIKKP